MVDHIILYFGSKSLGLTLGGAGGATDLDAGFASVDGTLDGCSDHGVLARSNCYTIERGPSTL